MDAVVFATDGDFVFIKTEPIDIVDFQIDNMVAELLENMPKNTFYNATDLLNDAVAAGKTVIRYPITGYWLDIGSHEEYKKANELVKHIKK